MLSVISILGTGLSTSTGDSVSEFMHALSNGVDALIPVETHSWKLQPKAGFTPLAFHWKNRSGQSVRKLLGKKLLRSFREALEDATPNLRGEGLQNGRIGVILASTKGFTEDFIWKEEESEFSSDPLTPLLNDFLSESGIQAVRKICVSNACASSLAALAVAQTWMTADRVDHVIVLACDAIDSFVLHGFQHLRVLSPDRTRPFAGNRSGFHLGDAAACVILSKKTNAPAQLIDVKIDSEGHAATRPSHSGESLLRATRALKNIESQPPELIIAHGTSTQANDVTEDRVFSALFERTKTQPLITGTKWSIGHTLGAAGLLDVIAAVQVLKTQKTFSIQTTEEIDATFQSRYLKGKEPLPSLEVHRVLITSLGFGGVHAAALVGQT